MDTPLLYIRYGVVCMNPIWTWCRQRLVVVRPPRVHPHRPGAGGVINMMPGSAIAKPGTERGGGSIAKTHPVVPHLIFLGS